jgi:hypothetical protein
LPAKLSGVNSVTGPVCPMPAKKLGSFGLAVLDAVPRRDLDRRVGGPVDVVGAPLEDRVHISAPERVVDCLDRLDVLFGAHELLLSPMRWLATANLTDPRRRMEILP